MGTCSRNGNSLYKLVHTCLRKQEHQPLLVPSSFLWGYIFSSVIGGALADKYGGKTVMAWGVSLWSLFTLLTPWAAGHSATTLLVIRALFGLAAGVAFPSMNLILSRWSPIHERSRAVGVSMAGFQLGNVLGLCLTPVVIALIGVSGPFVLFSCLGLLWLSMWVFGVANDPQNSTSISKAELQLIQAGKSDSSVSSDKFPPVALLLSKRPSWAIIFANFTNNWGYLVLLSWMPIYFKTVLNVDLKQAAWFSAVPWGVMAVSSCVAGAASDYLIKAGYPLIVVRKIMQSIGFIGPGLSLLCLNYATTPALASVILTVALSLSSFTQAGYFLNIQDIAPQSAGLLHGISNAAGTLAAIISTIGAGYFVLWFGSFKAFLRLTAMIYFSASIVYNLFAVGDPVIARGRNCTKKELKKTDAHQKIGNIEQQKWERRIHSRNSLTVPKNTAQESSEKTITDIYQQLSEETCDIVEDATYKMPPLGMMMNLSTMIKWAQVKQEKQVVQKSPKTPIKSGQLSVCKHEKNTNP
ncbi:hypothetical protein Cgig2_019202 [Carnegiea gigantea]|uniref:Major facilitator superfamily (MFS) profile domain-containing protein n=1 Tax=Carnegiea gigantea TaxID=171969 RepID=A0A9Q1K3K0_9CARY|nr:hypothetical protein Cgig2_019202 [Carnegiea gigantea]